MRQAPRWAAQEQLAHTLAFDVMLLGNWAVPTAEVGKVVTPTLVVNGESSPPMLRNAAGAVVAALPNARRRSLAGQTHAVDAAVLTPALVAFFQEKAEKGGASKSP